MGWFGSHPPVTSLYLAQRYLHNSFGAFLRSPNNMIYCGGELCENKNQEGTPLSLPVLPAGCVNTVLARSGHILPTLDCQQSQGRDDVSIHTVDVLTNIWENRTAA